MRVSLTRLSEYEAAALIDGLGKPSGNVTVNPDDATLAYAAVEKAMHDIGETRFFALRFWSGLDGLVYVLDSGTIYRVRVEVEA